MTKHTFYHPNRFLWLLMGSTLPAWASWELFQGNSPKSLAPLIVLAVLNVIGVVLMFSRRWEVTIEGLRLSVRTRGLVGASIRAYEVLPDDKFTVHKVPGKSTSFHVLKSTKFGNETIIEGPGRKDCLRVIESLERARFSLPTEPVKGITPVTDKLG